MSKSKLKLAVNPVNPCNVMGIKIFRKKIFRLNVKILNTFEKVF